MANYTTGAERYNKRMSKIWDHYYKTQADLKRELVELEARVSILKTMIVK